MGSSNLVDFTASPLTLSSLWIPEISTRYESATSAEQNDATSAEHNVATSAEQNHATSAEQPEESQSVTEQNLSSSDRESLDGSNSAPERVLSPRRYPKNLLLLIRNNLSVNNETVHIPQLKCFVSGLNENSLLIDIPMDKIGSLLGLRNSLTFIPSKLVKKCRKVHNLYLERIRDEPNSSIHWLKYYLLPTVMYANLPSTSRKNDLLSRLQLLEVDDWMSFKLGSLGLREDFSGNRERDPVKLREDYAMKFAKAGEIAKCLSTITASSSNFPVNEDLYQAIQRKHPNSQQSLLTVEENEFLNSPLSLDDFPVITANQTTIMGIIKSSKALVKPGLDKNRFEHLRQLIGNPSNQFVDADEALFLDLYTNYINLIIAGKVPNESLPLFRENEKWVIEKTSPSNNLHVGDQRDFRPLEGTSVARKIAALVVLRSPVTQQFSEEYFSKLQYSMDLFGTEKIIHQFRYGLEAFPEKDFFFADGDIAFNRLVRDRMLLETKRRLPSIYPFVQSYKMIN